MRNIKDKDLDIIVRLRQNARESLTKMSKNIQVPVSTIYDRMKEHYGELIKKHTSIIDFSVLGFNTRANICMAIEKEKKKELTEYLRKHQNINTVYKINNGYDYMIDGVFKHIKDMEEFCDNLREKFDVKEMKVYFIIDELMREEFMTKRELISLLDN